VLVSTFLIVAVPGSALQVAVAREIASGALGQGPALAATVAGWRRILVAATLVVGALAVALREPLAGYRYHDENMGAATELRPEKLNYYVVLDLPRNALLLEEAVRRVELGDSGAARVNLRGLLLPFVAAAAICALGVLVSPLFALARVCCGPLPLYALSGAWHAVWAVAAASAIRGIRDPRAPALAALCAGTVIAVTLALRGLW
jgi:hypothetical protein